MLFTCLWVLCFYFFGVSCYNFFYLLKLNIVGEMSTDKFATSQSDDSSSTGLLWKYITKLEKAIDGGVNIIFICNYYDIVFKESYLRVKTPLLEQSGHGV